MSSPHNNIQIQKGFAFFNTLQKIMSQSSQHTSFEKNTSDYHTKNMGFNLINNKVNQPYLNNMPFLISQQAKAVDDYLMKIIFENISLKQQIKDYLQQNLSQQNQIFSQNTQQSTCKNCQQKCNFQKQKNDEILSTSDNQQRLSENEENNVKHNLKNLHKKQKIHQKSQEFGGSTKQKTSKSPEKRYSKRLSAKITEKRISEIKKYQISQNRLQTNEISYSKEKSNDLYENIDKKERKKSILREKVSKKQKITKQNLPSQIQFCIDQVNPQAQFQRIIDTNQQNNLSLNQTNKIVYFDKNNIKFQLIKNCEDNNYQIQQSDALVELQENNEQLISNLKQSITVDKILTAKQKQEKNINLQSKQKNKKQNKKVKNNKKYTAEELSQNCLKIKNEINDFINQHNQQLNQIIEINETNQSINLKDNQNQQNVEQFQSIKQKDLNQNFPNLNENDKLDLVISNSLDFNDKTKKNNKRKCKQIMQDQQQQQIDSLIEKKNPSLKIKQETKKQQIQKTEQIGVFEKSNLHKQVLHNNNLFSSVQFFKDNMLEYDNIQQLKINSNSEDEFSQSIKFDKQKLKQQYSNPIFDQQLPDQQQYNLMNNNFQENKFYKNQQFHQIKNNFQQSPFKLKQVEKQWNKNKQIHQYYQDTQKSTQFLRNTSPENNQTMKKSILIDLEDNQQDCIINDNFITNMSNQNIYEEDEKIFEVIGEIKEDKQQS